LSFLARPPAGRTFPVDSGTPNGNRIVTFPRKRRIATN
jgi:hypothetical protein